MPSGNQKHLEASIRAADARCARMTLLSLESNPLAHEPCPCCDHLTLSERDRYETCPVCFWEDEPFVERVRSGANHNMTLKAARANFARFGACSKRCKAFVRDPMPWECPPP